MAELGTAAQNCLAAAVGAWLQRGKDAVSEESSWRRVNKANGTHDDDARARIDEGAKSAETADDLVVHRRLRRESPVALTDDRVPVRRAGSKVRAVHAAEEQLRSGRGEIRRELRLGDATLADERLEQGRDTHRRDGSVRHTDETVVWVVLEIGREGSRDANGLRSRGQSAKGDRVGVDDARSRAPVSVDDVELLA